GAEDRREDAAFGVGLARLVADEFPELHRIEAELVDRAHGIGAEGADDLAQGDLALPAIAGTQGHAVAVDLPGQLHHARLEHLVLGVQRIAAGIHVGLLGSIQLALQLQFATFQTDALEAVVDTADITLLQAHQLRMQVVDAIQTLLQGRPGGFALGDDLPAFLDVDQLAVEVAPFATLQHGDVGRLARVAQPLADHPGEVGAEQLAVTDLEQFAGHEFATFRGNRQAGCGEARARHFLDLHHLTQQHAYFLTGHLVVGLENVRRPEVAEATGGDHRQQTESHDDGDGDCATAHPHARGAALVPGFQVVLFHGHIPSKTLERRIPGAQALPDQFGQGVHHEGEHQQHQSRQEQHAIVGATDFRLGHFHGDVGRQGTHAFEDVDIHDRRVAGGHQYDHGLADRATHADHQRREYARAGGEDHHAGQGLPGRGAKGQGAEGQALGYAEYGILGDRIDVRDHRKAHRQAHHQGVALIERNAQLVGQ